MGDGYYPANNDPLRHPDGIIFMTLGGAAYLTKDGTVFTDVTAPLAGFTSLQAAQEITGLGNGFFQNGFTFLPGSVVRYDESKGFLEKTLQTPAGQGWFHLSDIASFWHEGDVTASSGVNFTIVQRDTTRATGVRNTTWTWRSAPFAQPDGTQSVLREVVVLGECYSASTYTVTATNNVGATVSVTTATLPTGKHDVHVPLLMIGDYCDVTVTAANNGSGEAPSVERIRLWFGMGHSL
jgi:hypothetical protein